MLEPVVSIVIICFTIGGILKEVTPVDNKLIPYILGILGGLIGGMLCIGANPLESVCLGIISGLSSTGSHQIVKTIQGLMK